MVEAVAEQPEKLFKAQTITLPARKKALKKKAVPKPKPEQAKQSTSESGNVSEYEEFFKELSQLTRKQHERGGILEAAGQF